MYDWQYMTDVLARCAPAHVPGTANGYHAFSFGWLVGELIQRVSGRTLSEVIRSEIAQPLQLDGLFIGTPAAQHHRAAKIIRSKHLQRRPDSMKPVARQLNWMFSTFRLPIDLTRMADALVPRGIEELDWSSPEMLNACIPAANGMFTARSLAKTYAALAAGGAFNGARLLSEKTLQRATEVQNRRIDLVVPVRMCWRLGYHKVFTLRGSMPRSFGHFGFGGSGAWADPQRDLAVALVLNSGMGTPFGDTRIVNVSTAALRCAERRARK
jgi:CubicO group peptidase (beta-lactamase class C family)